MATVVEEIKRAKLAGDQKVSDGKFTGSIRSLENPAFEVGDTWTFPEEYEVYKTKINGSTAEPEYIWVEVEGSGAKKFFPSTLTKSLRVYEEGPDGLAVPVLDAPRVVCSGAVAEDYRKFVDPNEGMAALKGLKVRVTKMTPVPTVNYANGKLKTGLVPTIEYVDKK